MSTTNKKLAALLRDVAENIEKIGEASQTESQKRSIQLRRLESVFKEEFVTSEEAYKDFFNKGLRKAFKKPKKSA